MNNFRFKEEILCLNLEYVYGIIEHKNPGSTDATFAVRNACIQNNKLCKIEHSNSYKTRH